MRYLLALPVGKPILALSRILTAAVIGLVFSTFSVTIVLLLAGIPDIFGIGLIVVGLFLASISLSSLGVSLATYIVGEKVFPASDLIGFWLIFVSPIFYPIGVLPAFLLYPALLNPVTYGLGLVRAGIHIGTLCFPRARCLQRLFEASRSNRDGLRHLGRDVALRNDVEIREAFQNPQASRIAASRILSVSLILSTGRSIE